MFDYISNINAIEQFSWVLKRGTDVDDGTQKERAPCLLRVCLRGLADENVHGHRITVGWNTNSSTECPKQLDTLSKLMLMYDPEGREQGGQVCSNIHSAKKKRQKERFCPEIANLYRRDGGRVTSKAVTITMYTSLAVGPLTNERCYMSDRTTTQILHAPVSIYRLRGIKSWASTQDFLTSLIAEKSRAQADRLAPDKNDTSTKGEQDLKQLAVFPAQKLPVSEFIWDATNATSTLASSHETLLRKWQLNEGSVEAQEKLELDVLMMA
ncbi:hypothetical protein Plhal304r1_c033g0104991 [Plasmopara halstedii]